MDKCKKVFQLHNRPRQWQVLFFFFYSIVENRLRLRVKIITEIQELKPEFRSNNFPQVSVAETKTENGGMLDGRAAEAVYPALSLPLSSDTGWGQNMDK